MTERTALGGLESPNSVDHRAATPCRAGELFTRLARFAATDSGAKVAVVHNDTEISYVELVAQAAGLAEQIALAGVRPHERVAVILGNSPEFVVAAFALWKCGAVLVPLNPQLQSAELCVYARNVSSRAIVTSVRNADMARQLRADSSCIEHLWLCGSGWGWRYDGVASPRTREDRAPYPDELSDECPALTQYSTGSTGYARSVTRTHRMLLGECESVAGVLGITPVDRILGVAPFFHSHGLMNAAILALLSGSTLHIVDSFLPSDVADTIEAATITVFPGAPFMFQPLVDLALRRDFSTLRWTLSAGAPIGERTTKLFRQRFGVAVRQLYGCTETGVICIQVPVAGESEPAVGPAIPGVSVSIVDDADREMLAGGVGRIRIRSAFAAWGYDRNNTSNESYFRGRSFFPGDLGRVDHSGTLVLCGRHRGFVNVSGHKVDPVEVERALLELPGVREAVVFGIPNGAGHENIKAVLVAGSRPISEAWVHEHLRSRLADFKHPCIIEFRTELPRSPLGKVLRKYLIDEASSGEGKLDFDLCARLGIRSGDAFSGQGTLRLSMLPPFLRVLLVTDGTVTRTLEAYFGEQIDIDVLTHAEMRSEQGRPHIGVRPGDSILRRCVILRGLATRTAYAFAESIVVTDCISADLRRTLIEGRKGIGELLAASRTETFRELLAVNRARAAPWATHLGVYPDECVVTRSYRIRCEGRAAIEIEEVFPERAFLADST